jgi:diguanylate cyclase (GGDEF)-like protein
VGSVFGGFVLRTQKLDRYLSRYQWVLGLVALAGVFAFSCWLRQRDFSSGFVLFCYLEIVGSLLCFTSVANALVHFRGTRDRFTLTLALGFLLAGLIETLAIWGLYSGSITGAQEAPVFLSWMIGQTALAGLLVSALALEHRVPHSRHPRRETTLSLALVGIVTYLTGAAYLSGIINTATHPAARLARGSELLPAALFLVAAIAFSRRSSAACFGFGRSLCIALWINVACHIAATQSLHAFDAPFTFALALRTGSYALILGGTLLDNARLFEQVRQLAVSDSLTGLGNYRTLLNALETEIQRSSRTGRGFALILMDLDNLKQINDRHGHLVGSRAICRLGDVLRVHSRSIDVAARYGGDEFALVLPEAGVQAARRVGERIRERLSADGEDPPVTVSVGAAVFPQDGHTVEELFDAADRNLYGMKRGGRILGLSRIAACL